LSDNPAAEAQHRLLAVDDNPDSAELVARIAARCGYDARTAHNPRTVRQLLIDWRPAVVTLDLCMPEADGIDLLSVLVETRFSGRVLIISGQEALLRRSAAKLGTARGLAVTADIQKPVDVAALRLTLIEIKETL
jgi:two-component system, chemotaxis family, chemotaxis protein CheY